MSTKQLTTETGVVASVNDKGFRLRGHDAWLNFSRFPDRQVPHPMQGETVMVTYDAARWIEELVIGEVDISSTAPRADKLSRQAVEVLRADLEPVESAASVATGLPPRELLIVRECALRAAVDYCAASKQADPAKVDAGAILPLAAQLEARLTRPVEDC